MHASDLSVVIPTSGRWAILERTLRALAEQTIAGFPTIVIVNGLDQIVPLALRAAPGVSFLVREDEGPGVARNLGVRLADTPLLLFLNDDTIPVPELVQRHLERHAAEPEMQVAVLGHVSWHPEVARRRVNRWLDWSGTQFDYRQLSREGGEDAGFGRFYTSNVSLKRELFLATGGFDPDFRFGYEDIDFGWRAAQLGMRLRYEPQAVVHHLHQQDLDAIRRRAELNGVAERLMASKHDWFQPYYRERMIAHAAAPAVSRLWPAVVDLVPERAGPIHARVRARADRWYHQQIAARFDEGWERQLDLEELRAYLGERFDLDKLRRHTAALDAEAAAVGDEARFYRTSEIYLYDLTVFAMSGTKEPYRRMLTSLLEPGARLLDYGCGIGSDGLRLLQQGYRVEFADFANPSVEYLRWRLARRGLDAPVHDLDADVPGGFDAAYAFDVIEHVDDPFAFLAALEERASIVMVNLLEPIPGDTPLHRELPIRAIVKHAARRGLLRYRRYHDRVHLIAYRGGTASERRPRSEGGSARPGRAARLRSAAERHLGPVRRG